MSKIVQAVNAMIANKDKIYDVQLGRANSHELFFRYGEKFIWSIFKNDDSFSLWFYPKNTSDELSYLAQLEAHDFIDIAMMGYSDKEIGTREAKNTFSELYSTVEGKLYNMDSILDEIIDDLSF